MTEQQLPTVARKFPHYVPLLCPEVEVQVADLSLPECRGQDGPRHDVRRLNLRGAAYVNVRHLSLISDVIPRAKWLECQPQRQRLVWNLTNLAWNLRADVS